MILACDLDRHSSAPASAEGMMRRAAGSGEPPQYSVEASDGVSMMEPYHHAHASAHSSRALPPFAPVFQSAFSSTAAHHRQPLSQPQPAPSFVTFLTDDPASAPLPPTVAPFRMPVVPNVHTQYHADYPLIHPTTPSNDPIFVSLPPASVPPLQFITLPGTANTFPLPTSPAPPRDPAPHTAPILPPRPKPRPTHPQQPPAPPTNHHPRPSSHPQQQPLTPPPHWPPPPQPPIPPSNNPAPRPDPLNVTFTAPQPRSQRPGLNFADVALENPRRDSATRPSPWSDALQARETVTSRGEPASRCAASESYKGARKALLELANPAPRARGMGRGNTPRGGVGGLGRKATGARQVGRNGGAGGGRKRGAVGGSCPRAAAGVVRETRDGSRGVDARTTGYQGVRDFGLECRRGSNATGVWDGETAGENGRKMVAGANREAVIQALRTGGGGGASETALASQENVEKAVECLMTLAMTSLPRDHDSGREEARQLTAVSNAEEEGEVWRMNSKSDRAQGRHLISKASHPRQTDVRNGDSGMQMENNFGNFGYKGHSHSSAYQLAQPNQSQPTNAAAIPAPDPSSMANTPRPAQRRPPPPAMSSQAPLAECTEGTPVDIRETRDLFTRTPTTSLPHVSRDRSLAQQTRAFEQSLTAPQQVREQVVPRTPQSSADVANGLHHPTQVARPLFQERQFVPSPPGTSQTHRSLVVPHHRANPSEHQQPTTQPATTPQTFQERYAMQMSTNMPASRHQFQQPRAAVPQQSPLPGQSLQTPASTPKQASKPQPKKRPTKNRTPRPKVAKPAKGTSKRTTAKTAKPKRPRPPKKPPTASPHVTTAVPASTADAVPTANTSPLITLPPLSTQISTPTAPLLRLRANFNANGAAGRPPVDSVRSAPNNFDLQTTQQRPSDAAQANLSTVHNARPSWPQVHAAPNGRAAMKAGQAEPRDAAPASSDKTKPANPRPAKTSAKKSRATIGKAVKGAGKAARSKQKALNLAKPPVVSPQSQEPEQVVKLRAPLPSATLRPETQPSGVGTQPTRAGTQPTRVGTQPTRVGTQHSRDSQANFATSMQHQSQETFDAQLRAGGSVRAPTGSAKDPVLSYTLSEKEKRAGIVPARPLHVLTEPNGEGQDASSPRTESTQQTLLPDNSSVSPSDGENPSESDDIPLAQTRKRARALSRTTPRAPDATGKTVAARTQHQGESADPSRHQSSTVSGRIQTYPALSCTTIPGTQVAPGENPSLSSRKRQNSSKSTVGNKRRKKNTANLPEQKSLTSKKTVQKDRSRTGEGATEDAVMNSQQDPLPEPKVSASPKKSDAKGHTKSKIGRIAPVVRKRPSSTKGQAKEKSKRSSSQLNIPTVSPIANGASNPGLSLSVREKDCQTAQGTGTKAAGDSLGSPVTPDRHQSGFRYTSKSLQKSRSRAGKESTKTGSNSDEKKPQTTACFADELRNLHASGILNTGEGISTLSSFANLSCDLTNAQIVLCVLCQKPGSLHDMVKHPCFPVKAFDVCKACSQIISRRVEEHGLTRKNAIVSNKEAITQRTTLFVMLIEDMLTNFAPSDRENRDIARIYEFVNTRNLTEMAERAESLSIPLGMLTVLRVTLRKVGFSLRGGKLRWPVGGFTLPTFADTRALVANALPARIEDLRKGILPGEAAWNETFGENEKLQMQSSSCAMYERIFSLIGVRLVHMETCNAHDRSTGTCKVKFEAVSVGVLMYRTSAMLSGTVTRELLAACWTKDEAFRFIDETEIELLNESFEGAPKSCCICGGSDNFREQSCSFRFSNCVDCSKSFCSICLLNVLGASEYLRSFGDGGYGCMKCRFQKNAELFPSGKLNRRDQDRRLRLHNRGGIKKRTGKLVKSMPPLLLLSPSVRRDILLRLESPDIRKALGVAKFCEVANDNSIRNAMDSQSVQDSHDICLGCKLPADGAEQDSNEGEVLSCGHESCNNVMHKQCLAPQRQARRRGSRSKWTCPHHQCSKCEQRDESKLLRCRTCPTTYCKEHMSLPSEVYLFSEKSFACRTCKSFLRVPQMPRLKPQGSKSERKKNQIAQALAIDQRKRSAAIKKLSEGPGCHEAASSSCNEFRRELEMI